MEEAECERSLLGAEEMESARPERGVVVPDVAGARPATAES